ncbi:hypothetical protein E2C01_072122 [Portunus trituberculatus]|uniref:Uncharacterized protein n=1 Tax=Portunus trituberculatus TaxID=210409 RepID=A0A5B7I5W2_PORTR|nr:hypothetical protein [Portunus trituberculatus]
MLQDTARLEIMEHAEHVSLLFSASPPPAERTPGSLVVVVVAAVIVVVVVVVAVVVVVVSLFADRLSKQLHCPTAAHSAPSTHRNSASLQHRARLKCYAGFRSSRGEGAVRVRGARRLMSWQGVGCISAGSSVVQRVVNVALPVPPAPSAPCHLPSPPPVSLLSLPSPCLGDACDVESLGCEGQGHASKVACLQKYTWRSSIIFFFFVSWVLCVCVCVCLCVCVCVCVCVYE